MYANAYEMYTNLGQKRTLDLPPRAHPTPLPFPNECKHYDYGLKYKITVKTNLYFVLYKYGCRGCLTV